MRPPFAQQTYGAVSTQDQDGSLPVISRRSRRQPNFRPIPLRLPFLIVFMLMFAINIVLIEVLLRTSVDVASPSAPSSQSTAVNRPERRLPTNNVRPRATPDLDCDPSTLTDQIAAGQAATASLCIDFTSSYAAHTKNLSYPEQTRLQQWIDDFSAASSAVTELKRSSADCVYLKSAGMSQEASSVLSARAEDMVVTAVQVGCGTSMITAAADCAYGVGFISISDFQLQSVVCTVCAATRANELVIATPSVRTSSPAKVSELTISVPAPAASPASPLPTVTHLATSASRPSISQPGATPVLLAAPAHSAGETTTVAGHVQPVTVSGPQVVTITTTDSNGQPQIVTATAAALPVANTYITTHSNGKVQTVVSTAASDIPGAYLYTITGPDGQVQTAVAQMSDGPAALRSIVRTNSLGQMDTIVSLPSALDPVIATHTMTDAQGLTHVVTESAFAVAGRLTTYTTTDARGRLETIIDKISSSVARYTITTQYTSLIRTTDAAGRSTSFSAVVVETVTMNTSPVPENISMTSSATLPTATKTKPESVLSSQEKIVNTKFTYGSYFLALYLPGLLAVVVKAAWEMVFSAIKLIQPFERMANAPTSAGYSIFAQYLSSSLSWDAFTSLAQGNPVPLLASILYVLVTLGGPIAAASMKVQARSYCDVDGIRMRCDPAWVVNVVLLRGVEVALGVCLGLVLLMLRSVTGRKSGVASDPSSLASLASLMNHETLLNDIQKISPDSDCATFKHALAQHQFFLEYHKNPQGYLLYGIIGLRSTKSDIEPPELESNSLSSNSYISNANNQYSYHSIPNPSSSPPSVARTTWLGRARNHLATDILGLLLPLTLFILVLTWYLDNNDDPLNNFFNSKTLWPKLLLVTLATLSALHLSHLERVVRITEPFRRLAATSGTNRSPRNRPSSAETTLLISRSGTPYSNLLQCISLLFRQQLLRKRGGRMTFQTLVNTTAVLADVNIIAAAGVAFNDAQIWQIYQMSTIASITLSAWTVLVYLVIMLWWRRCESVRAVSEDPMGVDVGVGTIGGTSRWLLLGQNSKDVLEALARIGEDAVGRQPERWDVDTEYRGRREVNASMPNICFEQIGPVGANGRRRWGLMIDGHGEMQERIWMSMGPNETGAGSLSRHEEYLSPRARGAEMGDERLTGEENTSGLQASWQVGRFPSLYGHNAPHDWRVGKEDERLWDPEGDLGSRRSNGRGS